MFSALPPIADFQLGARDHLDAFGIEVGCGGVLRASKLELHALRTH